MCQKATHWGHLAWVIVSVLALPAVWGQSRADAGSAVAEWRHIGNAAIELGLASVGTGPVARVWYSPDGTRLYAATTSGRVLATTDFEQWVGVADSPPPPQPHVVATAFPEAGAIVHEAAASSGRLYAFRRQAWRSDDGRHWTNLTGLRSGSVVGGEVIDLADSPRDPDDITIATSTGVWRSVDGGTSWTGLNEFLPNLPPFRIIAAPMGVRGLRIGLTGVGQALEWAPGEKTAWQPIAGLSAIAAEIDARRSLSQILKATITAAASSGQYLYAGASDGRLWGSSDAGRTWRAFGTADESGAVTAIFVDAKDPRIALAASGPKTGASARPVHVRKTMNGGVFWDDITGNLPDSGARGIAADHGSGAVYVATDNGVFMATMDLAVAGPAPAWTRLGETLPAAAISDVKLDPAGNQLYVAVEGYGVYATLAPHRLRDPQVVSAADYLARAAAPGSLLTVLGTKVTQAAASAQPIPVLAANATESQIQVPFDVRGDTLSLRMQGAGGEVSRTVPLQTAAPSIFVDNEGAPLVLDADSGLMLDAMHPARAHGRMQILATGLGRVSPDWPAGQAAPADNPPRVNAPVRVVIDRQPAEVTRAVLAPGYVGFYLIEITVPAVVNAGPAELYVETGSQTSNRVRVYLEP